jgi:hypothetical protein
MPPVRKVANRSQEEEDTRAREMLKASEAALATPEGKRAAAPVRSMQTSSANATNGTSAAPLVTPENHSLTEKAALPALNQFAHMKASLISSQSFREASEHLANVMGCSFVKRSRDCTNYVQELQFCLALAERMEQFKQVAGEKAEEEYCTHIDDKLPKLSMFVQAAHRPQAGVVRLLQLGLLQRRASAPEDDLAQEMTHDLEMNFNRIAPFGKEDTARELQDHAAKTQDTLVDAVENAEVAEIKRAVFRALTRLRAATIKEFDTIARLETQAIDAYNDAHHYRAENPLAHLHEDEAPVETDKLKSFH